jgi:hypothetical protein
MIKKIAAVVTYLTLIGVISHALHDRVRAQRSSLPPPVPPGTEIYAFHYCYPSTYKYKIPMDVRRVTVGTADYWETTAQSQNPYDRDVKTLYFQIDDEGCQWLNRKVANVPVSRQSYMSSEAATALSQAFFQPIFEQCEKDSQLILKEEARRLCGEAIAEGVSGTPKERAYLHPEDVDVLERLGASFAKIRHVEITKVVKKDGYSSRR